MKSNSKWGISASFFALVGLALLISQTSCTNSPTAPPPTATPVPPILTPTNTVTSINTIAGPPPTATFTFTDTPCRNASLTPCTFTYTFTSTSTATVTPTATPTNTTTNSSTLTPSSTATDSPTPTISDTATESPTLTPTGTPTNSPTITPTDTPSDTATLTPTDTHTSTFTDTVTSTPTDSLSAYATIGGIGAPIGIEYVAGNLWIATNTHLEEWAANGTGPLKTIWTFNGGVSFLNTRNVSVDPTTGNIYASENAQVDVFDSSGNWLTTIPPADFAYIRPRSVAVNSAGTTLYVLSDALQNDYMAYSITPGSPPTYHFWHNYGDSPPPSALLYNPYSIKLDSSQNIWVADFGNHRVAEYDINGNFLKFFSRPALPIGPSDLVVDGSGNVYVTEYFNNEVVEFDSTGAQVGQFGQGILSSPSGITTDGLGNIYVSDSDHNQIVIFH